MAPKYRNMFIAEKPIHLVVFCYNCQILMSLSMIILIISRGAWWVSGIVLDHRAVGSSLTGGIVLYFEHDT